MLDKLDELELPKLAGTPAGSAGYTLYADPGGIFRRGPDILVGMGKKCEPPGLPRWTDTCQRSWFARYSQKSFFSTIGRGESDMVAGVFMKRFLPLPIVFLMLGCASSITQRFDVVSLRISDTNEQIRQMNAKLDETNAHLAQIERALKRLVPDGGGGSGSPDQRP